MKADIDLNDINEKKMIKNPDESFEDKFTTGKVDLSAGLWEEMRGGLGKPKDFSPVKIKPDKDFIDFDSYDSLDSFDAGIKGGKGGKCVILEEMPIKKPLSSSYQKTETQSSDTQKY